MVFLRSCLQSSRIFTDSENVLQFIHYPKNSAVTKCTSSLLWKIFRKIYGGGESGITPVTCPSRLKNGHLTCHHFMFDQLTSLIELSITVYVGLTFNGSFSIKFINKRHWVGKPITPGTI